MPVYYNRTGPGSYETKVETGKNTHISAYQNAPQHKIFTRSTHSAKKMQTVQDFTQNSLSATRFSNDVVKMESVIGFLNPTKRESYGQIH